MRHDRGMTQHQLADIVGVHKSNISMWETGFNYPCPENRALLMDALESKPEIKIDYLHSTHGKTRKNDC